MRRRPKHAEKSKEDTDLVRQCADGRGDRDAIEFSSVGTVEAFATVHLDQR